MPIHRHVIALAVVAACVVTPTARAQSLFVRSGATVYELGTSGGRAGRLVSTRQLPACGVDGPDGRTWSVLNGRYLAWSRIGGACLFDTLAGTVRSLDLPGTARVVAASDASFVLVFADDTSAYVLRAPDAAPVAVSLPVPANAGPQPVWRFSIADRARRLVAIRADAGTGFGPFQSHVTLVDLSTGVVEHSSPIPGKVVVHAVAARADASAVVVTMSDYGLFETVVAVVNPATGAILARDASLRPAVSFSSTGEPLVLDEARGIAIVPIFDGAAALDTTTLARLATLDAPRTRTALIPPNDSPTLDYAMYQLRGSGDLLVWEGEGQRHSYYGGPCLATRLVTISGSTGRIAQTTDLARLYGQPFCGLAGSTFLVNPPPSPAGLAASSTAGITTFTWSASPGATHYVLEAGTAPGLANIGSVAIGGTSLSVPGVPAGRYYVRVRAVGVGGQGPRTADVELILP